MKNARKNARKKRKNVKNVRIVKTNVKNVLEMVEYSSPDLRDARPKWLKVQNL
jgi:hypothetical protein